MARIKLLRQRLGWSQKRMAQHLHCSQPTVWRMESGQPEPGPVSVLLDQLEASSPAATAAAQSEAVPSGAVPAQTQGAAA